MFQEAVKKTVLEFESKPSLPNYDKVALDLLAVHETVFDCLYHTQQAIYKQVKNFERDCRRPFLIKTQKEDELLQQALRSYLFTIASRLDEIIPTIDNILMDMYNITEKYDKIYKPFLDQCKENPDEISNNYCMKKISNP